MDYKNSTRMNFANDEELWDFHYEQILADLQGSLEEKEAIIRKRILRYFGEFKIDSESYFQIRNDINPCGGNFSLIPNKVFLYGIDYMPIQRAKDYFRGFVTTIRRIDDSHYLVEFRNDSEALAAINRLQKNFRMFYTHEDVMKSSSNGWIEMKPYF